MSAFEGGPADGSRACHPNVEYSKRDSSDLETPQAGNFQQFLT
jgi:hypothetical protein